jgi:hypothetical protein
VWILTNKRKSNLKKRFGAMGFIGLQEGLTPHNIHKGFEKTKIWPLNPSVMGSKMHRLEINFITNFHGFRM